MGVDVVLDGGVIVPGVGPVFVCDSCLRGEHQSYGCDHRNGPEDRRDCKNLSPDGKRQCLCNPDWPELTDAIRRHNLAGDCPARHHSGDRTEKP